MKAIEQYIPVVLLTMLCMVVLITSLALFLTGEFPLAAHEVIDPYFLLYTSACWNGVALGAIDIAKKHVTRTEHADIGMRVADYPIIQVMSSCLELLLMFCVEYFSVSPADISCFMIMARSLL